MNTKKIKNKKASAISGDLKELDDYSHFFGSSKGDQSKARIVSAAIQALGEKGYGHFTYDAVGQPLGLKRAQVAYHYPDKDELLAVAIKVVYGKGGQIVEQAMNSAVVAPLEHLKAYIEGTFQWLDKHPHAPSVVTLGYYLATFLPRYKALAKEVKFNGVQRIEKILLGYFHSESTNADDIRSLSLSIHAQIVGEVLYYFTTENTGYKSSVIEEIYTRILKVLTNSRPLN